MFGDADPLGAQLVAGHEEGIVLEIIGVVPDTRMRTLGEDHAPMFFTPYTETQMIVRTAGDAAAWVKSLNKKLAQTETASAVDVRPLSEAAAGAIFPMRVAAGFVGSMSGVGMLLALSGLSSSVWYATQRRTREMAIRAAVGATRSAILWTAARDALAVLVCGITAGIPVAIAAIRPLTGLLPDGFDPWSPAMFVAIAISLFAASAVAAWIPARNAAQVDPASLLREE